MKQRYILRMRLYKKATILQISIKPSFKSLHKIRKCLNRSQLRKLKFPQNKLKIDLFKLLKLLQTYAQKIKTKLLIFKKNTQKMLEMLIQKFQDHILIKDNLFLCLRKKKNSNYYGEDQMTVLLVIFSYQNVVIKEELLQL